MAKKTTVSFNQSSEYELDKSNHTWVFAESHTFVGSPASVHQASNLTNDQIVINGEVAPDGTASVGVNLEGTNSTVTIGKSGAVIASKPIDAEGDGVLVRNNGLVYGTSSLWSGIYLSGTDAHAVNNGDVYGAAGIQITSAGGRIENNGSIHGYYSGIELDSGDATAVFGKNSMITANAEGILVYSTEGQKSIFTNSGLIAMHDMTAFSGSNGREILVNHGTIRGDVYLEAGKDVFNNRDGRFSDVVYGGQGDDTFIVHSAKTQIYENSGEGSDLVKSTVSFSLNTSALAASEIENLTLLGSKNANATGNDWANTIKGNSGDNLLDGGLQNDVLTGGKGHDIFVFATNDNVDEVTDFHPGADKIDLSGVVDILSFKDMLKNHVSVSGGAVHITSGADELVLDHTAKAELHASDFIF
jgi:Ca2+-binding RTX toxin-like protein